MSTYGTFQTSTEFETSGITLDFGGAGKVKIARAGGANQRYKKRMQQLTKPHRRAIQLGTLDDKVFDDIVTEAYIDTIILGWEGITDRDGKDIAFNKQNAMKLFADLPDFFSLIVKSAENAALFRVDQLEGDAKNS
jgi:hypothetical protein